MIVAEASAMIRDPNFIELPQPAGAPAVEHSHHLSTGGWGALLFGAIVEIGHAGVSNFTLLCSAVGAICVVVNTYLNWRTSEARLAAIRIKCFREWEAQRDQAS